MQKINNTKVVFKLKRPWKPFKIKELGGSKVFMLNNNLDKMEFSENCSNILKKELKNQAFL